MACAAGASPGLTAPPGRDHHGSSRRSNASRSIAGPLARTVKVTYAPGRSPSLEAGEALVHPEPAGAELEPPAVRETVARAARHLQQHLLQLARVRQDGLQVRLERGHHLHPAADDAADRAHGPADQAVEVQRAGRQDLAPAEGEQLAGQSGRAVGGLLDLRHVAPRLGRERRVVQQQGDVAQDSGEQVVEVVGHAVRQLGEALGALQLPHPLLALPSVGDVLGDADQPGEASRRGGAEAPPCPRPSGTRRRHAADGTPPCSPSVRSPPHVASLARPSGPRGGPARSSPNPSPGPRAGR